MPTTPNRSRGAVEASRSDGRDVIVAIPAATAADVLRNSLRLESITIVERFRFRVAAAEVPRVACDDRRSCYSSYDLVNFDR